MKEYKITKEKLEEFLEDVLVRDTDKKFKIYVECTIDENGQYKSEFLEMFDKAMKEEFKK